MSSNLTQKAYRYIHSELIGGKLLPGSRLSNRGVAKKVGVSFTPVREALNRLVSEGLLEYRHGSGVFVPVLDRQDILEIYELREILETAAASRVCEKPVENLVAEMAESFERMAAIYVGTNVDDGGLLGDQAGAWQAADSAFHLSLLRAAGNRRLLETVGSLRTSLAATTGGLWQIPGIVGHRFALEPRTQIKRTLDEHRRILDAIKQQDAKAAQAVMVEHIRSGLELALDAHDRNHMEDDNSFLHG